MQILRERESVILKQSIEKAVDNRIFKFLLVMW